VFALSGLSMVAFGAYVQINSNLYKQFIGSDYVFLTTFIIVIGIIIFVIAFFGCCGSCSENTCMVYTFAFLLFFILLAQFGAAIAAFVLEIDPGQVLETNMEKALVDYGVEDHEVITNTWDAVQEELECCGVTNFTDWRQTERFQSGGVPDSCCKNKVSLCGQPGFDPSSIYTRGCLDLVNSVFVDNMSIVGVVALVFALVEMVGIIMACTLGDRIHRAKHYHRFD